MKIILSENRFCRLLTEMMIEYNSFDGNHDRNPYEKRIESDMQSLENLIHRDGIVMINIRNGRDYLVYELLSLANAIGKRYCLCQLLKDGKPYGSVYTKPMHLFKMKNY
jgi:hypothetical protein